MTSSEKEQIKLNATFWNNLAVGVALGSFLLPFILNVYGDPAARNARTFSELQPFFKLIWPSMVGLFVTLVCRNEASKRIAKLQD